MLFKSENLLVKLIMCKIFESMVETILQIDLFGQVSHLYFGLHQVPDSLTFVLQKAN